VVIDIDDKLFLEIRKTRARDVGTLDHKHGVVRRIDCGSNAYIISAGQLLICVWTGSRMMTSTSLSRRAITSKDRVTIPDCHRRANVGGDRETTFCLDQLDYLTKHNCEIQRSSL
jgi:hypothetical protein